MVTRAQCRRVIMSNFGDNRLPERFWDKVSVEPNTGCWLWTAYCNPTGYGRYSIQGRLFLSHRVAFFSMLSLRPEASLVLDHKCRQRSCVNPAHLEQVTQKENMNRGLHATKTHCKRGHLFDEANTYRSPSRIGRRCRACLRITTNERRRKYGR